MQGAGNGKGPTPNLYSGVEVLEGEIICRSFYCWSDRRPLPLATKGAGNGKGLTPDLYWKRGRSRAINLARILR
jgi:hypothetical protein